MKLMNINNHNVMLIAKIRFGSHLYGTNTENSDTDFKGIYLPTREDFLLDTWQRKSLRIGSNKIKKEGEKNTKEDVDFEVYSLHYFIKMALEGETVTMDMLHAPTSMTVISSPIWEKMVKNRHRFYTRNLKSFVGYARQQCAKYGLKGSRLADMRTLISILDRIDEKEKLRNIWHLLPETEYTRRIENSKNNLKQYVACDKILQESITVKLAKNIVNKYIEEYGNRAIAAENNNGVDWKAVSHAVRAAYQVKHILLEKNLVFPLREAKTLLKIKKGELSYNHVSNLLEDLIDEVYFISKYVDLPEEADTTFWKKFIINNAYHES